MHYVGCKKRLLPFIHNAIKEHQIEGNTFCDLFAGTATVGHYFKQQGYRIISNDLLYCSYVQQRVKVGINIMPSFKILAKHLGLKENPPFKFSQAVLGYLNQLNGIKGFVYHHYSPGGTAKKSIQRLYFMDENAKKIDMIREIIESWRQQALINDDEFYILLYALLEEVSKRANTTGIQNGFLKKMDQCRARRPIQLQLPTITESHLQHEVYCQDSLDLLPTLDEIDILYLDPPYTATQYAAAYHLLETVARWDFPRIRGVTGLRDYEKQKSLFCYKRRAYQALKQILDARNYCHLLMSYSGDSIIPHKELLELLNYYGVVKVHTHLLPRYNSMAKSDWRCNSQTHVKERLYYLKLQGTESCEVLQTFALELKSPREEVNMLQTPIF